MTNSENPVLLSWHENAKYWIHYSATIRAMFAHEVKEFFPHDQMNFPAQMILVTGTKPAAH